jgi:hypothetical protein
MSVFTCIVIAGLAKWFHPETDRKHPGGVGSYPYFTPRIDYNQDTMNAADVWLQIYPHYLANKRKQ